MLSFLVLWLCVQCADFGAPKLLPQLKGIKTNKQKKIKKNFFVNSSIFYRSPAQRPHFASAARLPSPNALNHFPSFMYI